MGCINDQYIHDLTVRMHKARLTYYGYDEKAVKESVAPPELLEQYKYQIEVMLHILKKDGKLKDEV